MAWWDGSAPDAPDPATARALRWTAVAGMLGALLWTIGDALILGARARPSDYPLLLETYASRIDFEGLAMMLPSTERRLAAGALIADVATPLYLFASWHFFLVVRPAGRWKAWAVFALLVCGAAWSPLGHAAFYYVAMAYRTILVAPIPAHGALLELGGHFHQLLLAAWILPVATLTLALLALGVVIGTGGTLHPRWAALIFNPVGLLGVGAAVSAAAPDPLQTWLAGAGFNVGWLVLYAASAALLWRRGVLRRP